MKQIVNVDLKFGIGLNNQLLVKIPHDLEFFKQQTLNKIVVMGKSTFLSLPKQKPLPNRINIVLTHQLDFNYPGVIVASSIQHLLEILKSYNLDDVYVIGGASIYQQLLPYCDQLLVTKTFYDFGADRFYINLNTCTDFKLTQSSEIFQYQQYEYQFLTYERIK